MKKGTYIAVIRNDQYVRGYKVARFNRFKDSKIHYQTRKRKPNQQADYYQELTGDQHPKQDYWKDVTGSLVTWEHIESTNTYEEK